MDEHADMDEQVDLGEEVTDRVKVHKPTGVVVSTRLEPQVADCLMDWSARSEQTVSQLVREAVIAYLHHLESPDSRFIVHTEESRGVQISERQVLRADSHESTLRIA